MYDYTYIYDYVPTNVETTSRTERINRIIVLGFMDGDLDNGLRDKILEQIIGILARKKSVCIVAFAPAATEEKTVQRFGKLAAFLAARLSCEVFLDAVTLKHDADPILTKKEYQCNNSRFNGKNVILLAGVYVSGNTLQSIGDLLMSNGASSVEGLFVAKVKECTKFSNNF